MASRLGQHLTRERSYSGHIEQELPIRLGSALFSKLAKRYWEQPHVADLPLVVAVESFASEDSLLFSETALAAYLFGRRAVAQRLADGTLFVTSEEIDSHQHGSKTIPSGFFYDQPEAEHVSAVLFKQRRDRWQVRPDGSSRRHE